MPVSEKGVVEARFIELESKIAFLENLVETLNDVICDQQKSLDALRRDFSLLSEQFASIGTDDSE